MTTKMIQWWDGRSKTFSHLCGESFSHGEVVMTAVGVFTLLLLCGIVETL